jgi:hypothetical protein
MEKAAIQKRKRTTVEEAKAKELAAQEAKAIVV